MAEIRRTGSAIWRGDLRRGKGKIASSSGALEEETYTFGTRFEDQPGTNPEELIAAAHAACFSMAFSATLADKGYIPEQIETKATCIMTSQKGGGFKISKMQLDVTGKVPGLDEATFKRIAEEADKGCPVSNLLRDCMELEYNIKLG